MEKRFIDINELSEYLGVSKYTLYSWTSLRRVPCTKFGKLLRFDMHEIGKWISEGHKEVLN